jgi:hypothetical protein
VRVKLESYRSEFMDGISFLPEVELLFCEKPEASVEAQVV